MKTMLFSLGAALLPLRLLVERTISDSGEDAGNFGDSALNIIFVVAFAVGISFLSMWLSRRGRRK